MVSSVWPVELQHFGKTNLTNRTNLTNQILFALFPKESLFVLSERVSVRHGTDSFDS